MGIKKRLRSIEYRKKELDERLEESFRQLLKDLDNKKKKGTENEERSENRKEV